MKGVALKVNQKLGGDNWAFSGAVGQWLPSVAK
jgi:hypothetical protein